MPGPNLLVVELCRDGGEVKKHIVADARVYGKSSPSVGERASLAAMGILAQCGELRAGDRLTVRLSVEWEDVPPDNLDETRTRGLARGRSQRQTHARGSAPCRRAGRPSTLGSNVTLQRGDCR
jgi:hypothetical protein